MSVSQPHPKRPIRYENVDLIKRLDDPDDSSMKYGVHEAPHTRRRHTTGRHFVPRMNAWSHQNLETLTYDVIWEALGSPAITLPTAFNWASGETRRFVTPIMDQGMCGGCWAFSVSSALSARVAIARNIDNPLLNPIDVMAATIGYSESIGDGCDGGDVTAASQFLEQCGVVGRRGNVITPNQFRQQSEQTQNPSILNRGLPSHAPVYKAMPRFVANNVAASQCVGSLDRHTLTQNAAQDRFFARKGCTKQIYYDKKSPAAHAHDIVRTIQLEVYVRGPVSAVFMVYPDFYDTEQWKVCPSLVTGDPGVHVYVHEWTDTHAIQDGEHAVVITGWGCALSPDGTTVVPYWICENYWGTSWGDQGYFNIAMWPFNKAVGLDVPFHLVEADGTQSMCGGVTVLLPDLDYRKSTDVTEEESVLSSVQQNGTSHAAGESRLMAPALCKNAEQSGSKFLDTQWLLLVLCAVVIVACTLRLRRA